MGRSATFIEILIDIAIWLLLCYNLGYATKKPYSLPKRNRIMAYLLILLFCLFPFFGGDYFHYLTNYNNVKLGHYTHLENVYIWIIQNVGFSYTFFRFIVWGIALLLTIKAYHRLEINSDLALAFFGIIYLPWFSYARASLAMSLIFFGISYIAKPVYRKRLLSYLLGFFCLAISVFFHRTAIIGIVCSIGGLFLRNPKKNTILIIILTFPIIVIGLKYLLNHVMSIDPVEYGNYISSRQRDDYLLGSAQGGISMGLGPYIMVFLARAPIFLWAIAYVICVFKGYFHTCAISIKIISSYAFLIVVLAAAFSIDLGYNTYVLYYRTLIFAHIPFAVFMAYLKESNYLPKYFSFVYYLSIFGVIYTLVYSAYCTL